ncbi:MAG: hypothetical protein V1882_05295 [Candidatus Omnitrophota bacterium]
MKEYINGLEKAINDENEHLNLINRCEKKGIQGFDYEVLRRRIKENISLYQRLKKQTESSS